MPGFALVRVFCFETDGYFMLFPRTKTNGEQRFKRKHLSGVVGFQRVSKIVGFTNFCFLREAFDNGGMTR